MEICCKDLSIKYASAPILAGVTFEIKAGDFVGIIGPNGSGKTTLLKAIAGILAPTQGAVEVDGRPLKEYSPQELAALFGVVPQKSGTEFAFTVREMVSMGLYSQAKEARGRRSQRLSQRVQWALAEMDLVELAERPVTVLSGGEWQRVLIARALAQNPQALLLDEVTTHLDIRYKTEILEKVKSLNRSRGLTVVAILHELELAAEYASKLLVLKDGRIHSVGPPEEVLSSQVMKEVFGVDLQVVRGARGEIILQSVRRQSKGKAVAGAGGKGLIHVVAGGGSGVAILEYLAEKGFALSMGAVNREDADWVKAKELGIKLCEEIPFAPLSPEVRARNLRLMEKADLIVVTDVPFGPGNVGNLEDVLALVEMGKEAYLLAEPPIAERDFTGGEATRLWQRLAEAGARLVPSQAQLLAEVTGKE